MVTHPPPDLPLEGEGILSFPPLQGEGLEGDGVRRRNAMLKCDKVELDTRNLLDPIKLDTGKSLWELCGVGGKIGGEPYSLLVSKGFTVWDKAYRIELWGTPCHNLAE
jgi:hypothetical protein